MTILKFIIRTKEKVWYKKFYILTPTLMKLDMLTLAVGLSEGYIVLFGCILFFFLTKLTLPELYKNFST